MLISAEAGDRSRQIETLLCLTLSERRGVEDHFEACIKA